ncbi:hypothetical protein GOC13_24495 [Sinorhizobium meliloti]|nr:hypothetical protein [Sinorhizobium meliloti]
MKDACGNEVALGDTVMLAHTAKSAGIRWTRCVVSRMTAKSFWYETPSRYAYGDVKVGDPVENGPKPLGNCVIVEKPE